MKATKYFALLMSLLMTTALTACGDDDDNNSTGNPLPGTTVPAGTEVSMTDTEMTVSGTWTAGQTINIDRHLIIPEGKTLTIEPGVNIIVSDRGVGVNHAPIEIIVRGSLFSLGTKERPVTFSVDSGLRNSANTFAGLWGGIVCQETCPEMVLQNTTIEYTGGEVIEGSPSATNGIYTAGGDNYPNITTTNISGRYVIQDCTIRNGKSDGIYMMGGQAIIAGNRFEANGYTGAEAVNIKAGVKADIADNIIFSPNTNGLKLSSAGQSETRPQCQVNAYNNTIINAGWRRDGEKGGCIYVEKNALVRVVNNLMANCKFRAQTPKYTDPGKTDGGYDPHSVIDYNFYASGSKSIALTADMTVANPAEGYAQKNKNYSPDIDTHSLISKPGNLLDPAFAAYSLDAVAYTDYVWHSSWDLHLTSGSPALTGAAGTVSPFFATGLTVGSKTYTSPALQHHFGALAQ